MNDHEFLRVYDFVDRLRRPFLGVTDVEDEAAWRIIHYLMRSELEGYPVTISKLALVSNLPHGTAIRRIQGMIDGGLIERRAASETAKRFTLHPTARLSNLAINYAAETKALIAEIVGGRNNEEHEADYYFGAPQRGNPIIPPINLLTNRVTKGVELQFLLNDDNYFAAMRNMWSDFRNNLASAKSFKLVHQNDLYREGLANGARAVSAYDMIAIDMPWLGEFASKGLVLPIGEMIREFGINPMDFHPSIWSTTTWQRVEYGVPIYCTIEVLACRSDLFEGEGLALPRTFDDVISAGRAFHNPAAERYGIAWNAAHRPLASSFMFFLGCCGQSVLSIRPDADGLFHREPRRAAYAAADRQRGRPAGARLYASYAGDRPARRARSALGRFLRGVPARPERDGLCLDDARRAIRGRGSFRRQATRRLCSAAFRAGRHQHLADRRLPVVHPVQHRPEAPAARG